MTWQQAWDEGRTPWDAGRSAPVLQRLVDEGSLPRGRAFVPGAGAGYDLLTLASDERRVVGLDLAAGAKTRFDSLAASHPHRDAVDFVVGDAFAFTVDTPFDLIWDYTFLCALPPELRPQWAEMVDRLLAPGGELVALIFPVVPGADPEDGPPYPMTTDLVSDLVAPSLDVVSMTRVAQSNPGREGKEWLGRFKRR